MLQIIVMRGWLEPALRTDFQGRRNQRSLPTPRRHSGMPVAHSRTLAPPATRFHSPCWLWVLLFFILLLVLRVGLFLVVDGLTFPRPSSLSSACPSPALLKAETILITIPVRHEQILYFIIFLYSKKSPKWRQEYRTKHPNLLPRLRMHGNVRDIEQKNYRPTILWGS